MTRPEQTLTIEVQPNREKIHADVKKEYIELLTNGGMYKHSGEKVKKLEECDLSLLNMEQAYSLERFHYISRPAVELKPLAPNENFPTTERLYLINGGTILYLGYKMKHIATPTLRVGREQNVEVDASTELLNPLVGIATRRLEGITIGISIKQWTTSILSEIADEFGVGKIPNRHDVNYKNSHKSSLKQV